MPSNPILKIALVDDHKLFRRGIISLIEMVNSEVEVLFEADDGLDLQKKINKEAQPDIILMDINMPRMDGFACVKWLTEYFPLVKILVVSMIEKEETIVKMLKLGVKGYLCKDVEPDELREALYAIVKKGYYYTEFVTGKLIHSIQRKDDNNGLEKGIVSSLSDRENQFLQLVCSELTYHEIAAKMFLSPKTIDGYRNALFEKLHVKSRVGLVLYLIKNGLVNI